MTSVPGAADAARTSHLRKNNAASDVHGTLSVNGSGGILKVEVFYFLGRHRAEAIVWG